MKINVEICEVIGESYGTGWLSDEVTTKIRGSIQYKYNGYDSSFTVPENIKTLDESLPLLKKQILLDLFIEEMDDEINVEGVILPMMNGDEVKFICASEFFNTQHYYDNSEEVINSILTVMEDKYEINFILN